jgi:hypothetical protein
MKSINRNSLQRYYCCLNKDISAVASSVWFTERQITVVNIKLVQISFQYYLDFQLYALPLKFMFAEEIVYHVLSVSKLYFATPPNHLLWWHEVALTSTLEETSIYASMWNIIKLLTVPGMPHCVHKGYYWSLLKEEATDGAILRL